MPELVHGKMEIGKKLLAPAEEPPKEPPPTSHRLSVRHVQAKVDTFENIGYRSHQGSFRIPKHKLPYKRKVPSRIGSLSNLCHKPGGGQQVKVFSRRVDFRSGAQSRIGEVIHGNVPSTTDRFDQRGSIVDKLTDSLRSTTSLQEKEKTDEVGTVELSEEPQSEGQHEITASKLNKHGAYIISGTLSAANTRQEDGDGTGNDGYSWSVDKVDELLTSTQTIPTDSDPSAALKDKRAEAYLRPGGDEQTSLTLSAEAGGSPKRAIQINTSKKSQVSHAKWRF
ncbi:microtubule-associated protein 2-like isoform X3 [Varroa destructor]|uniref:Microtubule-associated protein n=1 Tax=Varroa destructor TaxID=109461 RepID=A0A7M7KUQ9_VARDE|nr:microtubule-associated protein 2-like isoform X3 [Varroa destructor]